jgi:hypothetical protein
MHNDQEVKDIIENEGAGYAILHYTSASKIKSPKTRKLWSDAEKALKALIEHVGAES